MPIRVVRPRKEEGLKKFIIPLYERPTLKFLSRGEPWAPIADLIYGPDGERSNLEELKKLWVEFRGDIISAHKHYQPKKKPWGCRFDRGRL